MNTKSQALANEIQITLVINENGYIDITDGEDEVAVGDMTCPICLE